MSILTKRLIKRQNTNRKLSVNNVLEGRHRHFVLNSRDRRNSKMPKIKIEQPKMTIGLLFIIIGLYVGFMGLQSYIALSRHQIHVDPDFSPIFIPGFILAFVGLILLIWHVAIQRRTRNQESKEEKDSLIKK